MKAFKETKFALLNPGEIFKLRRLSELMFPSLLIVLRHYFEVTRSLSKASIPSFQLAIDSIVEARLDQLLSLHQLGQQHDLFELIFLKIIW